MRCSIGLVWAGELAGAARDRALFAGRRRLAHHLGMQRTRAFFRKRIFFYTTRFIRHHAKNLRNDVAGALDAHRIADAHVEPLDLVGIVQGRVLHHDAADGDRFELGDRRQRAGAADLDLDVLDDRGRLLGREFVRDRPARIARHVTEPLLPIEAIDFVDHAVDVVVERGALRLDLAVKIQQRLDRAAHLGQRIGLEAATLEPLDHARLRVGRHGAHLAPGISEKAERPRGGDRGVELTQRTGGGVARIDIKLLAGFRLALVEREEGRLGHVDFAAHLAHRRNAFAFEQLRNVVQRLGVGGDVLTLGAVAAGRGSDELAVLVAQRHRQPIDLRLGGKHDFLVLGQPQEAADAADKIDDIGVGKGVVERQHRHRVPHLGEARRGRGADALRQAFARGELREARFDGAIAPAQRVIFGVGHRRRIVLVIAPVVPGDVLGQPRVLGFRLLFRELLDQYLCGIPSRHGADISIIPGPAAGRSPESIITDGRCCVLRLSNGQPQTWNLVRWGDEQSYPSRLRTQDRRCPRFHISILRPPPCLVRMLRRRSHCNRPRKRNQKMAAGLEDQFDGANQSGVG